VVSLDEVRREAAPAIFPRHVLEGCGTALCLFAAAFKGQQDAVWLEEAGIRATCVDRDLAALYEMRNLYPDDWEFEVMDVFDFATETDRRWDVVTVDCPTNLFDRCAEWLPIWCLLARKAVVLGTGADTDLNLRVPAGWSVTETLRRSPFNGGVYWTVLQP
jgi:hypothetical protein